MRTPSQAFLDRLAEKTLAVCELFEITLTNGTTYYFTTLDRDIVFDTHTYTTLPITRGPISYNINLSPDSVEISLSGITQELALEAENGTLDGATVVIKRIFYDEDLGEGSYLTLFSGTASVSYNRAIITLRCTSILDSLNIQVPRNLYQAPCNHILYSAVCGVIKSTKKISGVVRATSTSYYEVFDDTSTLLIAKATGYFDLGEIVFLTGQNAGVRRMVRTWTASPIFKFLVSVPYRYLPALNDTFDVYPGCDKTGLTCLNKFANVENFFGFVYIPRSDETLW
jgi:uncharacterized phage protein (TIGR02218 family)